MLPPYGRSLSPKCSPYPGQDSEASPWAFFLLLSWLLAVAGLASQGHREKQALSGALSLPVVMH